MFTLIKGASVFTPKPAGKRDVLIVSDRIAWMGSDSSTIESAFRPEIEVVEAKGKFLVPGFIDMHVHIAGGGGEGGFSTRTPEVDPSHLLSNGITTAVGVLGTDGVTRSLEGLYAKAKELEDKGLSTYIYTGSYQIPVLTFTGSIQRDITLVDIVIGVGEIAIADHRSFHPTVEELSRIAAEARNGGMLSGKAGIVHLHLGNNREGLELVFEVIRKTGIPAGQFVPTHVNRSKGLLEQSIELVNMGGVIDLTAGIEPDEYHLDAVPSYTALKRLLEAGVDENMVTVSSDANGSIPLYDNNGELVGVECGSCAVLLEDIRMAVLEYGIPIEKVLKTVTANPARILKLDRDKGSLSVGKHADILILDEDLKVNAVYSKGRKLYGGK